MFEIDTPRYHNSESLYDQWADIFTVEHVCSPVSLHLTCKESDTLGHLSGSFPTIVVRTREDGSEEAIGEISQDLADDLQYGSDEDTNYLDVSVRDATIPFQKERCINADTPFMDVMHHLIQLDKPYLFVLKSNKLIGVFSQENFHNANFQMLLFRFFMEVEELANCILRRSPSIAIDRLPSNVFDSLERDYDKDSDKRGGNFVNYEERNLGVFISVKGDLDVKEEYYAPGGSINHQNRMPALGVHLSDVQVLFADGKPVSRNRTDLGMIEYFSFSQKIRALGLCEYVRHRIERLKSGENIDLIIDLRNNFAHSEIYKLRGLSVEKIDGFLRWCVDLRDQMRSFLKAGYLWDGTKLRAIDTKSGEELMDFQWPFELPERFS